VNITYKPATGNAKEDVELPLKLLMFGDYTMRPDPRPLEDRKPINVDKDNFQKVMSEQKLALNFNVKTSLSDHETRS
jgi:type VI secretion system protein ImpB